MLTRMKLGNFKSWRELDIELAPITVLFGTNSSGKSSVLQALLLLWQSVNKTSWDSSEDGVSFGGTNRDYVNLGSYQDTIFKHDLGESIKIYLEFTDVFNSSTDLREYKTDGQVKLRYVEDHVLIEDDDDLMSMLFEKKIVGGNIFYLGPIRQNPQRTYIWSGVTPTTIEKDGENTIAVLIASERKPNGIVENVSHWLRQLELALELQINALDLNKRFYEPRIAISNFDSSLLDVGFGVSQVLPVITMLFFVPEGSIVLLEQPELHLHPNAQAKLADLFLHVAETRKLQLIVESHSEHLLRRLQRRIGERNTEFATPQNIKAYFCQIKDGESKAEEIQINEYGQIRNWPENFFGDITGDLEQMTFAGMERRQRESTSG